jgi:hypothetical protein
MALASRAAAHARAHFDGSSFTMCFATSFSLLLSLIPNLGIHNKRKMALLLRTGIPEIEAVNWLDARKESGTYNGRTLGTALSLLGDGLLDFTRHACYFFPSAPHDDWAITSLGFLLLFSHF